MMRREDAKLAALAGECALELFLEEAEAVIAGVDGGAVAGASAGLEAWLIGALDEAERAARRARQVRTRVIAASLVAAVLLGAALMGYEPIRAAVTGFFAERFAQYSEYGVPGQTKDDGVGAAQMRFARPGYVPEGFRLRDWADDPVGRNMYWINETGDKFIGFDQLAEGYSTSVNTENARVWEAEVNGFQAEVIELQEVISIVFAREAMTFVISANLPLDECMRIAQSIVMDDELGGDAR